MKLEKMEKNYVLTNCAGQTMEIDAEEINEFMGLGVQLFVHELVKDFLSSTECIAGLESKCILENSDLVSKIEDRFFEDINSDIKIIATDVVFEYLTESPELYDQVKKKLLIWLASEFGCDLKFKKEGKVEISKDNKDVDLYDDLDGALIDWLDVLVDVNPDKYKNEISFIHQIQNHLFNEFELSK